MVDEVEVGLMKQKSALNVLCACRIPIKLKEMFYKIAIDQLCCMIIFVRLLFINK